MVFGQWSQLIKVSLVCFRNNIKDKHLFLLSSNKFTITFNYFSKRSLHDEICGTGCIWWLDTGWFLMNDA